MTTRIVTAPSAPPPVCPCSKRHVPALVGEIDRHHCLPQSWGGKSTPENLIDICPVQHRLAHACLNLYVKHAGSPPKELLAAYSPFTRALAKRAVDAVGGVVPRVFTASHPEP